MKIFSIVSVACCFVAAASAAESAYKDTLNDLKEALDLATDLCIDDHTGNQSLILEVIAEYSQKLNELLETLLEKNKAKIEPRDSLVEILRNVEETFKSRRSQLLHDNLPLLPAAIKIQSAISNTYKALEAADDTFPEPLPEEITKFQEKLEGALEDSKANIAEVMDLLQERPIDEDAVSDALLVYFYELKKMCATAVAQVTEKTLPAPVVCAALVRFSAQWEELLPFKPEHQFVMDLVRRILSTIQEAISEIEFPGSFRNLSSNLKFNLIPNSFSTTARTNVLAPKKVVDWDDLGGKDVTPASNSWTLDQHIQVRPPDSPPFNPEDDEDDAGLLFKNIDPEKLDYTVHQPSVSLSQRDQRREDFSTINQQFRDIEDLLEQFNMSRNHEFLLKTLPSYLESLVDNVAKQFPDVSTDLADFLGDLVSQQVAALGSKAVPSPPVETQMPSPSDYEETYIGAALNSAPTVNRVGVRFD